MAVAAEAGVVGLHLMRLDEADRRRLHKEAVLVVEEAGALVEVRMEARRDRVAGRQEILTEVVRDDDLLIAPLEQVQLAVGLLLELIERRDVPLILVAAPRAEQPHAEVRVAIEEAAEIARERLDAGTHRDEVVVRSDVGQLDLAE